MKSLICLGVGSFLIWYFSYFTYELGYKAGSDNVTNQYESQIKQYKARVKQQELLYAKENAKLKDEVILVKRDYESKLAVLNHSFSNQLQKSNRRAEYYRRQASNSTKCRSLATHTAKLDRAVTEGINVVEELSMLVKLRDNQLRQVGKQIKQERQLIE